MEALAGVGKTAVVHRLATLLGYRPVLENTADNPFLESFHRDRKRYALQAQLFFLVSRGQWLGAMRQPDLFSQGVVTDVLLDRDHLQAALCLSGEELAIYERVHAVVRERVPTPDLVVYLSAEPRVVLERLKARRSSVGALPGLRDIEEAVAVYNRFFFHFERAPLLVVDTSAVDLATSDAEMRALAQEVVRPRGGVRHYNPRA